MTKAKALKRRQVRAIAAYVADLQENMRLCQWHLAVMNEPPPLKATRAVIWIATEAHEADLYVDPAVFPSLSRAKQRQVLVHELCHLILEPLCQMVQVTGQTKAREKRGGAALNEVVRLAAEHANDDFAWLIAEHQPLPPRGWLD